VVVTEQVRVCECFARDGLQHEERFIATPDKIAVLDAFSAAGFPRIEATSYSNPERVPAFRDASEVLGGISRRSGTHYKATCPNVRAVRRALADLERGVGATELSLLVSASESHSQRNLRATRAEQWVRVEEMVREAGGRFRLVGVISVAFGCPIEGAVDPGVVIEAVQRFAQLGVALVSLGDTTGLATPRTVKNLFVRVTAQVPAITPIAHFHNTRGSGLANCVAALEMGCRDFDSSMGGVGGHPAQVKYGGGMTGNVATEDLVNLLEGLGFDTGLDLKRMMEASALCELVLGRTLHSMVARSGLGLLRAGESRV
jgi:hydroxymethylglutaryl-CoA lyase